jgi:hypothetical protein
MTAPPSARCWRAPAIAFAPRAESGKASSVLASRRRVCGRFVVCPMTYAVGATSLRSVGGRTCLAVLWTRTRQIPTAFVLPAPSGTEPSGPGYRAPAFGRERDRAPGTLPAPSSYFTDVVSGCRWSLLGFYRKSTSSDGFPIFSETRGAATVSQPYDRRERCFSMWRARRPAGSGVDRAGSGSRAGGAEVDRGGVRAGRPRRAGTAGPR